VHWGTSCPRIEYSCHGGIDTPTSTELIAHDRTDDDIADYIGADLMVYPELASFMNIFGLPANRFSFCCLDGNYSMDLGDIVSFAKKRVNDRGGS
jgi:amidophosphoribosyltransferase